MVVIIHLNQLLMLICRAESSHRNFQGNIMAQQEDKKKRRVTVAEKRRRGIRDIIWPNLDDKRLWLREGSVGFITIPRTLPLIQKLSTA